MTKSRTIWPVAIFSALLGGVIAVALGAALGLGGDDSTTTVVQQAPLSDTARASDAAGLTARDIYKRDAPGVVFIRANVVEQSSSQFGFPQQQQGTATGSGFVVDGNGLLLTNAHVVDGASKVTVQFANDKTIDAKILGKDRSTDIALLQVEPKGLDLKPLQLGSAKAVQVGDPVVAIGNPFGLDRTLTTGVVSALQREIPGLNGFSINGVIQTDAAINPGNSGGPLIDSSGRVIGINSQIETGGSGNGNVGIGFAVPIDTAIKLLPELKKGSVQTGYLGITSRTIDDTLKGLNLPVEKGVLVISVQPGSPAAKAGVQGGDIPAQVNGQSVNLGGDIITKIDGKAISSGEQLSSIIAAMKKGDEVKVDLVRDGKTRTVAAKLVERPQGDPAATQQQGQAPTTP